MLLDGTKQIAPQRTLRPEEIGIASSDGEFGIVLGLGQTTGIIILSAHCLREFSKDLAEFVATKMGELERQ